MIYHNTTTNDGVVLHSIFHSETFVININNSLRREHSSFNSSARAWNNLCGLFPTPRCQTTQNLSFWPFPQVGQRPAECETGSAENMPVLLHSPSTPSTTQQWGDSL